MGITGLSLYKFGKTTSIPFENENIETPYNVIKENKPLHTLILLDLRPELNKYMTVNEAIQFLLNLENKKQENVFTEETLCIACTQLGSEKAVIKAGKAKDLINENFTQFPQCLIIPGDLHFMEEEALEKYTK